MTHPGGTTLRDILGKRLPPAELALVPAGWQILGDIVIVSIPAGLEHRKHDIGTGLLELYPRCRCVLRHLGIRGQMREPERELIAQRIDTGNKEGYSGTETLNRENGCMFRLDASKIMFSAGNLDERRRMGTLGSGEDVVDMFAGIGYFSIPMAVHAAPKKILAIELNPTAFRYLQENIALNHAAHIIQPLHGDCAVMTPRGSADRVIMGCVLRTHEYLKYGIAALREGGTLHYHETVPEALLHERPVARVREEAEKQGRQAVIIGMRQIKKYSPGVWHVVVDARVM